MTWALIKYFTWCKDYGLDEVETTVSQEAVTIYNSHKIKKWKHMKEVIE